MKTTFWTSVRDRALLHTAAGIEYVTAWGMAERELRAAGHNPANPPTTIANDTPQNHRITAGHRKAELRAEFQRLVAAEQKDGLDYTHAFNKVRRNHVTLCNELDAPLPANDATTAPQGNPAAKALLGLSPDADQSEFETAWRANGCCVSPANHTAIAGALISATADKNGWTRQVAESHIRNRHPLLNAVLFLSKILIP